MTLHATWVHGNAVAIENPENLASIGHFGWGTQVGVKPGKGCWFHVPLPTPVIVLEGRTKVQKLFVLFKSEPGQGLVRNVHIWDGAVRVQAFDNLAFSGEHWNGLDGQNTFNLTSPHTVAFGMGISVFYQAAIGIDSPVPPATFIISTAGADFTA